MKRAILKKGEIKVLVYVDNLSDVKANPVKIIDFDNNGITVENWLTAENKSAGNPAYFMPWYRIIKVKETEQPKEKEEKTT